VYWIDIGDIKVRIKNVDEKCNFHDLDETYGWQAVTVTFGDNTFLMAHHWSVKDGSSVQPNFHVPEAHPSTMGLNVTLTIQMKHVYQNWD